MHIFYNANKNQFIYYKFRKFNVVSSVAISRIDIYYLICSPELTN